MRRLPYPVEEYEDRWTRVYDELEHRNRSTAIIWQRAGGTYDRAGDLFWLCNYASLAPGQEPSSMQGEVGQAFAALVFQNRAEPTLHICEPLDMVDQGQIATPKVIAHENLPVGVASALASANVTGPVLHNGDDLLPWEHVRILLEKVPEITWETADDLFWKIHRILSPREIESMRRTGAVGSEAMTVFMEALVSGKPECVAAGRAASVIVSAGGCFARLGAGHGPAADNVFFSNALYGYGTTAASPGEMVRGWCFGPLSEGNWLDIGRSGVCGRKPTHAQRTLLDAGASIAEEMLASIRPGVGSKDLGLRTDELMEKAGHQGDDRWWLYGHGIGKDFYMTPVIPSRGRGDHLVDTYEAGMGFTIELFLRHEGVGLAAFECDGIVTQDGHELLDTTPLVWW